MLKNRSAGPRFDIYIVNAQPPEDSITSYVEILIGNRPIEINRRIRLYHRVECSAC